MSAPATLVRRPPRAMPGRPALRVVRPAGGVRRRAGPQVRAPRVLAVTAGVALFASVGLHAVIAQDQLRLEGVVAARHAEQRRYEQLRLQVAQEEAPATIVARATDLGLVPATGVPVAVVGYTPPSARAPAVVDATPATRVGAWQRMKRHLAAAP